MGKGGRVREGGKSRSKQGIAGHEAGQRTGVARHDLKDEGGEPGSTYTSREWGGRLPAPGVAAATTSKTPLLPPDKPADAVSTVPSSADP